MIPSGVTVNKIAGPDTTVVLAAELSTVFLRRKATNEYVVM